MHNPAEPHIEIINTSTEKHLENFSEKIRAEHQSNRWRCLYTNHDPELIRDPCCKSIIIQFLKTTFDDADTTEVFWSTNGHLFIFFQGPVRPVVKSYEQFLDAISMDGKKIPYRFFWEIQDFWGYFDEILAETFRKDEKAEKNSERIIMIDNSLDKELVQQRVRRYKPLLMIVEDDATTRHFLQSAMEQYCDIVVAWNVQQAIALYEVMLPNIAFLDIELPDGNPDDGIRSYG